MSSASSQGRKLALEGFVIVASILVAFAIDAWWDERQEDEVLQNAVTALRAEVQANVAALDTTLANNAAYRDGIRTLIRAIEGDTVLPESRTERFVILTSPMAWTEFVPITASYQAIQRSGEWGRLPAEMQVEMSSVINDLTTAPDGEAYGYPEALAHYRRMNEYGGLGAFLPEDAPFDLPVSSEMGDAEGWLADPVTRSAAWAMGVTISNEIARLEAARPRLVALDERLAEFAER